MLLKLSAIALSFLLLSGCGPEMFLFSDDDDSWGNQYNYPESLKSKLKASATAQEFESIGISIDCESDESCADSLQHGIVTLGQFYQSFKTHKKRFIGIRFKATQETPSVASKVVYLPSKVTQDQLNDFFVVINKIQELEKVILVKFTISGGKYTSKTMNPIIDVFFKNSAKIIQENHRFKRIEVNGWDDKPTYNPKWNEITFIFDQMNDFDGQWEHIHRLFRARDAFGIINFLYGYGDKTAAASIDNLITNKDILKPYFNRLPNYTIYVEVDDEQNTSNVFKEFGYGTFKILILDSRFDLQYVLNAFDVYFKMLDIREYLGDDVFVTANIYAITQHKECLSKILSIKNTLMQKKDKVAVWVVDVGLMYNNTHFIPKDAEMVLYCGDSTAKIEEVVKAIP